MGCDLPNLPKPNDYEYTRPVSESIAPIQHPPKKLSISDEPDQQLSSQSSSSCPVASDFDSSPYSTDLGTRHKPLSSVGQSCSHSSPELPSVSSLRSFTLVDPHANSLSDSNDNSSGSAGAHSISGLANEANMVELSQNKNERADERIDGLGLLGNAARRWNSF
ncbi:unnamed protein product [Protopolystoma xenopodis]|uniref:Uncharacterized protein n=1 Tax=Protopolystoma xenopodis TaxID=117903 RepID=A0A3S5AFR1_9PLAT|nr:unnamed protein product [Protopolystoma xenopodis]